MGKQPAAKTMYQSITPWLPASSAIYFLMVIEAVSLL